MKRLSPINRAKSQFHLIGIVAVCMLVGILFFQLTSAWFKDSSITSNEPEITIVGTISLDVNTNFNFYNLALAPDTTYVVDKDNQDIGTYISTNAEHDIENCLVRIKFTCSRPEISLYFDSTTLIDATNYTEDEETGDEEPTWVYNQADGYYYCLKLVDSNGVKFNSGYTVDNSLDNLKANETVRFEFLVEALQSQYGAYIAEWTSAPQVFKDFASGL